MRINPDDVERLSPLVHHHIHLDGRYTFTLPEPLARGELRPLRDPTDPAEEVFDLLAEAASAAAQQSSPSGYEGTRHRQARLRASTGSTQQKDSQRCCS